MIEIYFISLLTLLFILSLFVMALRFQVYNLKDKVEELSQQLGRRPIRPSYIYEREHRPYQV
jgi:hypothetical protein